MYDQTMQQLRTHGERLIKAQKAGFDYALDMHKIADTQMRSALAASRAGLEATRESSRILSDLAVATLPANEAG